MCVLQVCMHACECVFESACVYVFECVCVCVCVCVCERLCARVFVYMWCGLPLRNMFLIACAVHLSVAVLPTRISIMSFKNIYFCTMRYTVHIVCDSG